MHVRLPGELSEGRMVIHPAFVDEQKALADFLHDIDLKLRLGVEADENQPVVAAQPAEKSSMKPI